MGTIDPLTSVGFEPAGWYLQPTGRQPNRWPRLQGFFHTEAAAYAAVFEMPSHDVELDLYCLYQNGTSMTYTMEGRVPGFEYWSSHSIHRMPALDTARLFVKFMLARPRDLSPVPVSAEEFAYRFDLHAAKIRVWSAGHAGVDLNIKRKEALLRAMGEEPNDETLEAFRRSAAAIGLERLPRLLIEQFAIEQRWPIAQTLQRARHARAIHDLMNPDDAVEAIFGWRTWFSPRAQAALSRPTGASARQLFAELNETLPARRRWRKIGVLAGPIGADVYER